MERKRSTRAKKGALPGRGTGRPGERALPGAAEIPVDQLTARATAGDKDAFLALVRFHSTFDPMPLAPELLALARIEDAAAGRLLGRMKRKEDSLLRPFPSVDMVFWGEAWVQEALRRFMWRRRGRKAVPDEEFIGRLWDASRDGAMLQLRIYKKVNVAPAAWVRVKYPHFANIGLTDVQMLKIARAEGCAFGEDAFLGAVRRFRRAGGL